MIMGHLEKLLQAAMDKHGKLEREKVNLQRSLALKAEFMKML
jgi:hypothetical protein